MPRNFTPTCSGKPGLAEYNRLAVKAWEKLPKRSGRGRGHDDEFSAGYERLKAILDFFAERAGDIDTRIALRAHDLSSAWRYLELAQFCQSQGRVDEALRRAEEGLWVFEDGQPDERLVSFTVELLSKAGRKADAGSALVAGFRKGAELRIVQATPQAWRQRPRSSASLESSRYDRPARSAQAGTLPPIFSSAS